MKQIFFPMLVMIIIFALSIAHAEEILLSTGSGPLDSVINPVKEAFEKDSGIKITVLFGGASLAFKQLYKGVSEAAAVGTGFEEILEIVKKEGFGVSDPEAFSHVTLGRGLVRTVVNKENPVSKLNKEQLKGIFTGKIKNWKEVGGNDSPIIVVLSTINPATIGAFRKIILDDAPYTREVLELGHMDELRGAVEVNAEAIAIGTSAILSNGTKQIDTPDVFRSVTLISKGKPSAKVQRFIDFVMKGPGRGLVKE